MNGIENQIVDIPGGNGLMGTDSPIFPADGESPLCQTRIKPFRMDAAAVTNARFEAFVKETGYRTEAERLEDSFVFINFLPEDAPHPGRRGRPMVAGGGRRELALHLRARQ